MAVVGALLAAAVGLSVFTAMAFLRSSPPTVDFTAGHQSGQPVDLTLQTVGAATLGAHPSWVSYFTRSPDGRWEHTTLWDLPAHTTVHVTILQYDTGSPLRNQFLGQVSGTAGGAIHLNGRLTSLVNSNDAAGLGVGHTFTIPSLGVNVPLRGVDGNAKNFCNTAPCAPSDEHNTVTFSFTTPGPGVYPWQCFVPCGAGWLYGTGGPMQTIGYMDGFLKVEA